MDIHFSFTSLTLDVTTPVELALASLLHYSPVSVVTPAATHERASVHAGRGLVAEAPRGAHRASLIVG